MKPSCRIIVDCGTTNTRALLIDGQNQILAKESREIGVRDTAITGTSERHPLYTWYQKCPSLC